MTYALHLVVMLGIYLMLAWSANLSVGYAGLLTLAEAAFFGVGAYLYAILSVTAEWPSALAVLGSVAGCAVIGLVFAGLLLRFRGEAFAVATIAFQMVVCGVFGNWTEVTGGGYGFADIPRPSACGLTLDSPVAFAACVTLAVLAMAVALRLFSRTSLALALRSLRDDEIAATALGHSPERTFAAALTLSAVLAAVPGCLFAAYVAYIDPAGFTIAESVFLLSILVVGGSGNMRGPLAGTAFMVLVPEILRFLGVPDAVAGTVREIVYGLLLIVFMYFRPRGFCGDYAVR